MKNKSGQRAREIVGLARDETVLKDAAQGVALSGALATADKGARGIGDIVKEPRLQQLLAINRCSRDVHV